MERMERMCSASFPERVSYAIAGIMRAEDSRALDDCFEMDDGAYVVAAIMRRAATDRALAVMIHHMFRNFERYEDVPWHATAAKLAGVDDLAAGAAAERKRRREAFAEQMREMQARQAPASFRTELTATGEQYVIPGCEKAPAKGGQLALW